MDLSKRVPESQEEMDDLEEIYKYYSAHKKLKGWNLYDLVARNILKNTSVRNGLVLDVGCGYGGLIEKLSSYLKKMKFIGIDISKNMVEFGNRHVANKDIKLLQMPGDKIKFGDNTFDLIISKDTIHHLAKPINVLKEMYRVLKHGGEIYIFDLNRNASQEGIFQVIQAASELNVENAILYTDSVKAAYTISEMKELLKKSRISNYKIFCPKVGKDFLKEYSISRENYLLSSNYLKDKWVIIIKKP